MRQIKFRAFHPKTQKHLVHDWGIGDGDDGYICNDENGELVYSGELIWEQFTGLLDVTGKEIYEGDIVLVKNYEYPHDILTCVVKYSEYSAAFYMADIKESNIALNFAHCGTQISVRIIGNILENNT